MMHYIKYRVSKKDGGIIHYSYREFEDIPFVEFCPFTIRSVELKMLVRDGDGLYHIIITDLDEFAKKHRQSTMGTRDGLMALDFVQMLKLHIRGNKLKEILNND
jgi:hypothetical protein